MAIIMPRCRAEAQKFVQTGICEHLIQTMNHAEIHGAWKGALPLLVKLVLINRRERALANAALPHTA